MAAPPNWKPKTVWTADCLYVLRGMNSESIDLIYLDPPFNSNANYAAPIGSEAAGAEFKDTWSLSDVDVEWINLIEAKQPALYRVLIAAMNDSDKSYLAYMAIRLLEMRRVLKPTGSIYLHCDPTMSHYLKLVMDAVFGRRNFRNEVVWIYRKWTNSATMFQRNHDCLLFYRRGDKHTFNIQHVDVSEGTMKRWKGHKQQAVFEDGVRKGSTTAGDGRSRMPDWWEIPILNPNAKERTGFRTQKPVALVQRIIQSSTNPGDMVLDPFCGCATTLLAAEGVQRLWAGIDVSPKGAELAVSQIEKYQGLFHDIVHRADIPLRTDLGTLAHPRTHRTTLYGQQEGNCAGCGDHFESRHFEVDHIISRKKGGTDHPENLQLMCGSCNRIKGDRGMEYLRSKLQLR